MEKSSPTGKINFKILILSLLTGALGFAVFAYFLVSGIYDLGDSAVQAQMPGTVTLNLKDSGSYTVFHEYTHKFDSSVTAGGDREAERMTLTLVSPEQTDVPVHKVNGSATYNVGGRSGYSLFEFQITQPGDYRLTGIAEEPSDKAVMFTLLNNFGSRLVKLILGSFFILVISGILSTILLIMALLPLLKKESN